MATSMSIEVDNPEDRSVWSSDIAPVVATVIQLKSVGYEYLEKGTLHGLPDAIRQNSCCCRTFWILTLSLALVTQLVHMTFLFDSAIQSATVTNIRYARVQELSLPFLTLCGHPGKFFDSDKLMVNNLSLSVALTFASMYGMFDPSVPTVSDKVDEALFHQALELDNRMFGGVKASNSRKLSLFLLKYTIDCENLFYGCQQGFAGAGKREKCCKSFRPVMTGRGLCYAFDHAGWNRSHVAGVFNGFSFYLNHSKLRFDDPVYSDSWKFGHLSDVSVSVSNGIEQSPLTNNYVAVGPGDDIQITTTTSLIKQLPKTSKCVDGATLDFYRDYTINNCVWERGFYKDANSPFCSIAFDLTKLGFDFANSTRNENEITTTPGNFTDCSPEKLRRTYLNNTLNYVEWVTRINVPNSEDICPFPCEYWEHSVSVTKNSDSFEIFEPNSLVKVARTSMNPHVNEVEKFGWQDYLCLAGGAMGLWTGSSVVTILQITVGNVMLFSAFIYNITWSQQEKKRRFRLSSSQTDSSINNII